MEIAVADMAQDRSEKARCRDGAFCAADRIAQLADRHADVGNPGDRTRDHVPCRPQRLVTRFPQRSPLFGRSGKSKLATAIRLTQKPNERQLVGHAGLRPVKFQKQHRLFRQVQCTLPVARPDRRLVEQLHAGDRYARLDCCNHGVDGTLDGAEIPCRGQDLFGLPMQPQACLDNQAQRAFGAGEQVRQIISRRRFSRTRPRRYQAAVGGDHFQAENIVAHAAVSDRGRSRRPRRNHPAERGIGAGIDGKEQPGGAQVVVELLARHARLDHAQKIGRAHLEDMIHPTEIDAKTIGMRCRSIAFERCSGAIGDDRPARFHRPFDQQLDLFDRFGLNDQRRRLMRKMAFALRILRQCRGCSDKARTKSVGKRVCEAVHIFSPNPIAALQPQVNWYYIGII